MKKIKKSLHTILEQYKAKKELLLVILVHGLLIFSVGVVIVIFFFYSFLPIYTRKSEKIEVPNLKERDYEESKEILKKCKLRYRIKDSDSYNPNLKPNAILAQNPKAGSFVKTNRTIYLSLNSDAPPLVKMPNLVNGSLRNAELVLTTHGLRLGFVKYIPDIAKNTVLKQMYEGQEIEHGELVPRNAKINITVGAGLGNVVVKTPDLTGKSIEEAKQILRKYSLQLGSIIYEKNIDKEKNMEKEADEDEDIEKNIDKIENMEKDINEGEDKLKEVEHEEQNNLEKIDIIFKQIPTPDSKIRIGSDIDVWVEE